MDNIHFEWRHARSAMIVVWGKQFIPSHMSVGVTLQNTSYHSPQAEVVPTASWH